MLHRKQNVRGQNAQGFTIIELAISISVISVVTIIIYTIFNTSFLNYLGLQRNNIAFDTMNRNSQRIATVVRGLTDITLADANELTFYSYFSPNDNYVSLVHYYLDGSNPSLRADVTPLNANPPSGTPQSSRKQSFTVIEQFVAQTTPTFEYLDSSGATLSQPIADLHTIKGIRINLAQKIDDPKQTETTTNSLTVSLRNRKTNL